MLRDLILSFFLVLFAVVDVRCFFSKQFNSRWRRVASIIAMAMIFVFESAYVILFFFGQRLPNELFYLFSMICIVSNTFYVLINASRTIRRTALILAALSFVFTMYFVCFITQEQIDYNGKTYIAEYNNVTSVSKTLVNCYEKRAYGFTESESSLLLDCGIVLSDKPDLGGGQYTVIEGAK